MSEATSSQLLATDIADNDLAMASLDFKEFSSRDADGYFTTIPVRHLKSLLTYMREEYRVVEVQQSALFIVLWCREPLPEPNARPFTVAGCIAVWKTEDEDVPPEVLPKDFGDGKSIAIKPELAADLEFYKLPSGDTLRGLIEHFPTAEYISYLNTGIIIELPQLSVPEHRKRLESLPRDFENASASLQYHNGPMARAELKRLKNPDRRYLEGAFDDSDYVKDGGCFYPGVMISAQSGNSMSAGILVEKAGELRLTVPIHCWDDEIKNDDNTLGDPKDFRVTQGDSKLGTDIGYIADRIGNTDIGLVKLDVPFINRFLEIDATAKTLLPMDDINFFDEFVIDSFVSGFQRLKCLGLRLGREGMRERELKGRPESLPIPESYVALIQGIYATSAPEITSKPRIQEGVCGSALVRISKATKGKKNDKEVEKSILAEGAVGGFMHWSDLQSKAQEENLLCYADAVDELGEAGWKVFKVTERRKDREEDEEV